MDEKGGLVTEVVVPKLPAPEVAASPVNKHADMAKNSKRKDCWGKRDAYFACLDKNGLK